MSSTNAETTVANADQKDEVPEHTDKSPEVDETNYEDGDDRSVEGDENKSEITSEIGSAVKDDYSLFDTTEMDFMNEDWKWPEKRANDGGDEEEEEEEINSDDELMNEEPFVRFRRFARAVKMLISVCHVCRDILKNTISQENWFALLDNLNAAALQQSQKKRKAFVRLVPGENRQLMELTFDANDYKSNVNTEELLTDEVRNIMLENRPGTRTHDQVKTVMKCMKGMCKAFREYPATTQYQIIQCSFLDRYKHNRVLLKRGLPPDGIYFVLKGTLIEKPDNKRNPNEIHPGEKLGEEDLVCGCARRATVITRHEVEVLFLHRSYYMDIFDMAADSNDSKNLEIIKQNEVLRHFPIQKLEENPSTWSTLKYKYGRLMVKDSNEVEWIYVIKSGEARVLCHLEPGVINVRKRRKQIKQAMEEDSVFHQKKKIFNFVSNRDNIKSSYNPNTYRPSTMTPRTLMSAPPTYGHRTCMEDLAYKSFPTTPRPDYPTMARFINSKNPKSEDEKKNVKLPKINSESQSSLTPKIVIGNDPVDESDENKVTTETEVQENGNHSERGTPVVTLEDVKNIPVDGKAFYKKTGKARPRSEQLNKSISTENEIRLRFARQKYINAPCIKSRISGHVHADRTTELPPFVQVETLHPGQTFGMRSCLDSADRGPSVSLVSGDCEVLAINKKFFLKHCDDAMFSLIRLKAKPFPNQEELIDRLDISMQWDEYRKKTVKDFLLHKLSLKI